VADGAPNVADLVGAMRELMTDWDLREVAAVGETSLGLLRLRLVGVETPLLLIEDEHGQVVHIDPTIVR